MLAAAVAVVVVLPAAAVVVGLVVARQRVVLQFRAVAPAQLAGIQV